MEVAQEGIEEFLPELLQTAITGTPQDYKGSPVFYSKQIPRNGFFNMSDSGEDVYRLLRAMDFGVLSPWKPAKTVLPDGQYAFVRRYAIVPDSQIVKDKKEDELIFDYKDGDKLVIKYTLVS